MESTEPTGYRPHMMGASRGALTQAAIEANQAALNRRHLGDDAQSALGDMTLENAINRLEGLCNIAAMLGKRTEAQADRLAGIVPANPPSLAESQTSPNGAVAHLHTLIDALHRTLSATEDEIARIERV